MPTGRKIKKRKIKKDKKTSFLIFISLILTIFLLAIFIVQELPKHQIIQNFRYPQGEFLEIELQEQPLDNGLDALLIKGGHADNFTFHGWMDSLTRLKEFAAPLILLPPNGETQLVDHGYFLLLYNEDMEQAQWVAHRLDKAMLSGNHRRKNNFRTDSKIITGSSHPNDYLHSGFDRGHLAPAGDFVYSAEAMENSFYMSNISPQKPSFNRGIWKKLEEQIRSWAREYESLIVITGPLIDEYASHIGGNQVKVPGYFYKVVLDIHPPEYKMIAFLLKNEKSDRPLLEYAITVDSLERFSGINFFPMLPDTLEKRLESSKEYDSWFK